MTQIEVYEILAQFRKPLIEKIIASLNIEPDSTGIDMGCGIGTTTHFLADKISSKGKLTGVDYSTEFINHAKQKTTDKNVEFRQGDINNPNLPTNSIDWIWSMDTLWCGSKELGCPAEEPDKILKQLYRALKPGGKIYLLFWTSQKFLPGYPLLEARLNASTSANTPYVEDMDSYTHVMNATKWLTKAKFSNVGAESFIGNIASPLTENDKKALTIFFEMLWGNTASEISKNDWGKFEEICTPGSDNFILNQPDYYGYYTYTLFKGTKK